MASAKCCAAALLTAVHPRRLIQAVITFRDALVFFTFLAIASVGVWHAQTCLGTYPGQPVRPQVGHQ